MDNSFPLSFKCKNKNNNKKKVLKGNKTIMIIRSLFLAHTFLLYSATTEVIMVFLFVWFFLRLIHA